MHNSPIKFILFLLGFISIIISCNNNSNCHIPISFYDPETDVYISIDTPIIGPITKKFKDGEVYQIDLKTCNGTMDLKVFKNNTLQMEGSFEGSDSIQFDTMFTEAANGDLVPNSIPVHRPVKKGNWKFHNNK